MNEREQIITFLLQACDAKNRQIEELQRNNTELLKKAATVATSPPEPPVVM